jgi:chromosome segregation ATPase
MKRTVFLAIGLAGAISITEAVAMMRLVLKRPMPRQKVLNRSMPISSRFTSHPISSNQLKERIDALGIHLDGETKAYHSLRTFYIQKQKDHLEDLREISTIRSARYQLMREHNGKLMSEGVDISIDADNLDDREKRVLRAVENNHKTLDDLENKLENAKYNIKILRQQLSVVEKEVDTCQSEDGM